MKIADIMTRGVISLSPEDSVRKAAERMLRYDVSGFPVLDHGKLVGMITQGDFLRRAETGTEQQSSGWGEFFGSPSGLAAKYTHTHARRVGEVMTRDVVTVAEDATLDEAVELMERHHVRRLPVVKNGVMTGILSRVDLLHAFIAGSPQEPEPPLSAADIEKRLQTELGQHPWLPRGSVHAVIDNGVVTLTGIIGDDRQRTALHVAIENIPGVTEIRDNMVGAGG